MRALSSSRYLLRIDDLCPTVAAHRWRQIAELIDEFAVQPILAIVPDNYDAELLQSPPDPGFWAEMRELESSGATIALHGYRHLCASGGHSMVSLAHHSEFAGVPEDTQRAWIGKGLRILRGHGLSPRVWVAPRHGFDRSTLRALRSEGIETLCDGFARRPFIRTGFTWIPQQLWAPCAKREGLWTICFHPNTAGEEDVENLRAFLRDHAAQFTSADGALAVFPPRPLHFTERAQAQFALWRIEFRAIWKRGWR